MKNKKQGGGVFGKVLVSILAILLIGVLAVSGTQIYQIKTNYKKADQEYEHMRLYKPSDSFSHGEMDTAAPSTKVPQEKDESTENPSLKELKELYPDVVGWLSIDGTAIDYPFVQGKDNEQYLRKTLEGNYLISGTVFMDYRAEKDFSGFNTVLYGHRMNNGTMFSDIEKFSNKAYFDNHTTGNLFLPDRSYSLEVFAYLVVDSKNPILYDPSVSEEVFLPYVKEHALQYRDVDIHDNDHVITLSTCTSNYSEARSVLVAKLTEIPAPRL